MTEQFSSTPQEATQAAISMALSNFNGIFALAAVLGRAGFIEKRDVEYMHDNMLRPLTNDGALPEMMALQTKRIDELCSTLLKAIEGSDGPVPE